MISFQDLMKGFGVVTVMNAKIYKLKNNLTYRTHNTCSHNSGNGFYPSDFECTHLYLDALKISNINQEGSKKSLSGGQNGDILLQYGKTMTLEMTNALGSAQVMKEFFGCEIGKETGTIYVNNKFPSAFAIEGDTFFIDQQTGEKVGVKIFIPQFRPNGIFNLVQDAEGEATVFDCNGVIAATYIRDNDCPNGHEVFYLISDKSWPEYELGPFATIEYIKTNYYTVPEHISILNDYSSHRSQYSDAYIVKKIFNDASVAIIPETYEGLPVRGIADSAAANCTQLTTVTIPSSVQAIGNYAFFGCTKLTTVHLQEGSLFHLGEEAFANTSQLTHITLPECLQYIHTNCFRNSKVLDLCEHLQDALVYNGWVLETVPRYEDWAVLVYVPSGLKIAERLVWGDESDLGDPLILNSQGAEWFNPPSNVACIRYSIHDLGATELANKFINEVYFELFESDLGSNYSIELQESTQLCSSKWLTLQPMWDPMDDCMVEPCRIQIKIPGSMEDYFDNFFPFCYDIPSLVEVSITYV